MINLIINGANGTMGKVLAQVALSQNENFNIVAGIDKYLPDTSLFEFPVFTSIFDYKGKCDAIIDFSMPDSLKNTIQYASKNKIALVIATTGLSEEHYKIIDDAANCIPIFLSANMSLGVNLQKELICQASNFLGEAFDIEIIEKHHNKKVDAPSGTAIALADAISEQFPNGKEYVYDRHSVRQKRKKSELGLHSVRGGTVVGEHNVLFLGEDEIIEITHRAHSKKIFAVGALRAASYICKKDPRLYSMHDIVADQNSDLHTLNNQSIITIFNQEYAAKKIVDIFNAIANANINIDMISQAFAPDTKTVDISFTLLSSDLEKALLTLKDNGIQNVSHMSNMAKFAIEGFGMEHRPGIAAKMFEAMANADIEIKLITTSETKITYCIDESNLEKAKQAASAALSLI